MISPRQDSRHNKRLASQELQGASQPIPARWEHVTLRIFPRVAQGYPIELEHEDGGTLSAFSRFDPTRPPFGRELYLLACGRPPRIQLEKIGRRLFEGEWPVGGLLEGTVRDQLRAIETRAGDRGAGILLRLVIEPLELRALPWEYLFDPFRGSFLSTDVRRLLCRSEPSPAELTPLRATMPLRGLFIAAGGNDLDVDGELAALRQLEATGGLVWEVLKGGVSRDALADRLSEGTWHILHFCGHGVTERGGVLLLDDRNGEQLADEGLADLILNHRTVRLVVLNACDSGMVTEVNPKGMAARLIQRGVPAVVVNQRRITDPAAVLFARHFYQQLLTGRVPGDVAVAVTQARYRLLLAGSESPSNHQPHSSATRSPTASSEGPARPLPHEFAITALYLSSRASRIFKISSPRRMRALTAVAWAGLLLLLFLARMTGWFEPLDLARHKLWSGMVLPGPRLGNVRIVDLGPRSVASGDSDQTHCSFRVPRLPEGEVELLRLIRNLLEVEEVRAVVVDVLPFREAPPPKPITCDASWRERLGKEVKLVARIEETLAAGDQHLFFAVEGTSPPDRPSDSSTEEGGPPVETGGRLPEDFQPERIAVADCPLFPGLEHALYAPAVVLSPKDSRSEGEVPLAVQVDMKALRDSFAPASASWLADVLMRTCSQSADDPRIEPSTPLAASGQGVATSDPLMLVSTLPARALCPEYVSSDSVPLGGATMRLGPGATVQFPHIPVPRPDQPATTICAADLGFWKNMLPGAKGLEPPISGGSSQDIGLAKHAGGELRVSAPEAVGGTNVAQRGSATPPPPEVGSLKGKIVWVGRAEVSDDLYPTIEGRRESGLKLQALVTAALPAGEAERRASLVPFGLGALLTLAGAGSILLLERRIRPRAGAMLLLAAIATGYELFALGLGSRGRLRLELPVPELLLIAALVILLPMTRRRLGPWAQRFWSREDHAS